MEKRTNETNRPNENRNTVRNTERKKERKKDRQIDRQKDRQIDGQKDRQKDRCMEDRNREQSGDLGCNKCAISDNNSKNLNITKTITSGC